MTDRAARIRAENPSLKVQNNNRDVVLTAADTPEEYEAIIAEWVAFEIAAEATATVATEHRTLRQHVRAALTALDADYVALIGTDPLTTLQLRAILARSLRVQIGLIKILVNANVIEPEGG